MKIDWHGDANSTAVGEIASVLLTSPRAACAQLEARAQRGKKEIPAGQGQAIQSEQEQLERLAAALEAATPAVPETDYSDIKKQVLGGARSGLAKVFQGQPGAPFTVAEHVALEAVILTNGRRPSLFVRNGFINLEAADIGKWNNDLGHFWNPIRKVISSVGRINIPVDPWFAGTCFVIANGRVLTNRHVLEEIATLAEPNAWTLKWPQSTTVDFIGEEGAAHTTKFRITGVDFTGPDAIKHTVNFKHLDLAILRVDPASDKENNFPGPVTFEKDATQPEDGRRLYVVGFPGRPRLWMKKGKPLPGFETAAVIASIFNDKFGVKRLAPGLAKKGPGKLPGDQKSWICSHDASTLRGNSGSCVVDLKQDGFRIVALHFAGISREQNWAHAAGQLRSILAAHSAKFVA